MSDQRSIEDGFARGLDRDRRLLRICDVGTMIVSISTIVAYLILIMPLGRTSPWLVLLSLYSIATRASMVVADMVLLFPRFLLHLEDADPVVARAALSVLERRRGEVVRPILRAWMRPCDDASVAGMAVAELASLARARGIDAKRRLGAAWLAAWVVLTALLWGTVIATGGGPTT
jgi:hypothetical protein